MIDTIKTPGHIHTTATAARANRKAVVLMREPRVGYGTNLGGFRTHGDGIVQFPEDREFQDRQNRIEFFAKKCGTGAISRRPRGEG